MQDTWARSVIKVYLVHAMSVQHAATVLTGKVGPMSAWETFSIDTDDN